MCAQTECVRSRGEAGEGVRQTRTKREDWLAARVLGRRIEKERKRESGLPIRGRGFWLDTAQTVQGAAGGNFTIGVEPLEYVAVLSIPLHRQELDFRVFLVFSGDYSPTEAPVMCSRGSPMG